VSEKSEGIAGRILENASQYGKRCDSFQPHARCLKALAAAVLRAQARGHFGILYKMAVLSILYGNSNDLPLWILGVLEPEDKKFNLDGRDDCS
jgi:hypothetical protein